MESGEPKPLLQSPGDTRTSFEAQPPAPALKVPKEGPGDLRWLSQERQPSADALGEKGETCSAAEPLGRAEGQEAAWNLVDFFGEEIEGEVKDLTQQEKVDKTEEKMKAAPEGGTAAGTELVAEEEQPQDQGQPGSEGALCAGITLQEGNILSLREISGEAGPGQGCEMEPPADTGGVLLGRGSSLAAGQVAGEPEPCLGAELLQGTDKISPAEIRPQSPQWAELTRLVEAMSLLTLQSPSELIAKLSPAEMSPQPPQRAELPQLVEAMSWLTLQSPSEVVAKLSPVEMNPQSPQWAELTRLVEAMSRLTLQSPAEATAKGVVELHSTPPVSRESPCPQSGSLEPPTQLLDPIKLLDPTKLPDPIKLPDPTKQGLQGTLSPAQGTGSLCCAGPEALSELSQQPRVVKEGDAEGKTARENTLEVPLHSPCTELEAEQGGELSVPSDAGDGM